MIAVTFFALIASVACQSRYGSIGNVGIGVGTGGAIVFPNHVPNVRPVGPGRYPQGGVAQPAVGVVRPSVGVGSPISQIGGVQPISTGVVRPQNIGACNAQSLVHATVASSEYHFSWCNQPNQKFDYSGANSYCARLGAGWQGISIENNIEDQFVKQTIGAHQVDYIWTSGRRSGPFNWVWGSGSPFVALDWSHTGSENRPQPDNAEDGIEDCLALLNDFYSDGIRWHDVACYHTKPIICERRAGFSAGPAPISSLPISGSRPVYG